MNTDHTVTAIVVDDHPLFRRGVVELLKESPRFDVLKSYGSAIELCRAMPLEPVPGLLLMDLQMPEMSGLEALKQLRPQLTETKIVMLTVSMDSETLIEAISIGADGYLLKDTDPDQIISQLESVLDGHIAINASGVTLLAEGIRSQSQPSHEKAPDMSILDELTERERQTLQLISQGLSNKLIARELGISDGTVKVYVKNLLRKLGLHSRLELAAWNHKHRVLPTEEVE